MHALTHRQQTAIVATMSSSRQAGSTKMLKLSFLAIFFYQQNRHKNAQREQLNMVHFIENVETPREIKTLKHNKWIITTVHNKVE